jgi:tetratricopeptide (TPR) repeat protein
MLNLRKSYKYTLLILLSLNSCSFFSSNIQEITSFKQAETTLSQTDSNTLVIFDVDETLTHNPLTHSQPWFEKTEIGKNFIAHVKHHIQSQQNPADYEKLIRGKRMIQYTDPLIEPEIVLIIKHLQDRGVKVIALTHMMTGSLRRTLIPSLPAWRYQKLKEVGIDFSQSFSDQEVWLTNLTSKFNRHPVLYHGILMTDDFSKGQVLGEFLDIMHLTPKKIIFFDDRPEYVTSVQEEMKKRGIPFQGFIYKGMDTLPQNIDQNILDYQLQYLKEHDEFISDQEAQKNIQETYAMKNNTLENFDDLWSLGEPALVEKKFKELLPEAQALENKSMYLQILSQIALAQAMQQKFNEAHQTIAQAEKQPLAQTDRGILLEKGRVFQQQGDFKQARYYFEQSYEVSKKFSHEFDAVNAAHMIAIVAENIDDKISWNQQALEMALTTNNADAKRWLGPLYNNLGQNYLEAQLYEKALSAFQKALEYRQLENYTPNIRVAKWAIGHTLRMLNRLEKSLKIQEELVKEYAQVTKTGKFEMPAEMFTLTRGWVYEELAHLYSAKKDVQNAQRFAQLALEDLSENTMFTTTQPDRLKELQKISENQS